ncbi:glycoside hydrolase family 19 protein [Flavobacterium sp.]|uniref:glycoside hydrolase family 19 protein n=1 Tax=Flavobacterium sp. TaxID=239 RepID=UPI003750B5B2
MNFLLQNSTAFLTIFKKYAINTPLRVAHFLGQLAHESANFTASVEDITFEKAQKKYQNHKYLGNKLPGDGYKFRGRGLMQLTGRANYEDYKKYSGIDVIANPDLVSQIPISLDVAGWFWTVKKLNPLADKNDVLLITKKINGGTNGLDDRIKKTAHYRSFDILGDLKKKVQKKTIINYSINNYKPFSFWNLFSK